MATKTILLVDDEPRVLQFVALILERVGFRVLSAAGAMEAMEIEAKHKDTIHLLVSDIVMPEMSGRDLALQLSAARKDMKVLLMSGYLDAGMMHLEPGWAFIRKPFMRADLIAVLQDLLGDNIEQQEAKHAEARGATTHSSM